MMTFGLFRKVEFFIFIEFIIVSIIVIITYLNHSYFLIKHRLDSHKLQKLNKLFSLMQDAGKPLKLPYLNQTELLLQALSDWDNHAPPSKAWQEIKTAFIKEQMLPVAIQYIAAKNWIRRFFLLRCFEYVIDAQYEPELIRLIKDTVPLISIRTTPLILLSPTKALINALIDKIYQSHQRFQKLYLVQLHASPLLYDVILEKLQESHDPKLRHLCYRILKQIGVTQIFYAEILKDVNSTDFELKLSAIRILGEAEPKASASILITLLKDPNWVVRNNTLQSISQTKNPELLKYVVAALDDESWWVKINAAKVVSNLTEAERNTLNIDEKYRQYQAFDEPQYFLKIHTLRERE